MIIINFGRWNHAAGRFFVLKRIYWKGYKWTPFCRVKKRYELYHFADTNRGLVCGRLVREEKDRLVLETDKGGPVPWTSVLKSSVLSHSEVCELVRILRAERMAQSM